MGKELTIIGATGHLSTRMTRRLIARGMRLKIIARNPDKAHKLFGEAAIIVPGDVQNSASLRTSLEGSKAVYIHLNTESIDPKETFQAEREGVFNIVEAAEAVGVTQLIQIAGIESLRPDFFHGGLLATNEIRHPGMEAVRKSPIPHTFVLCSVFLDSLPRYVTDGTLAVFGDGNNHIHFTNTTQLADHLFEIAGNPDAFGQEIPVQGREGVDFLTGAKRFFGSYDSRVQIQQLPLETIDGFGLPAEEASFLKHVSEVMAGMREAFVAADAHERFGAPNLSIEEFAAELRAERPSAG